MLTLLMGGASFPDLMTGPFESGMLRLVLQSANLYRGIHCLCIQLHALPMVITSFLDLVTRPFEYGVARLVPWLAIL